MGAIPIAQLLSLVVFGRKTLIKAVRYLLSQTSGKIFQSLAFLFNILRGTWRRREHLLAKGTGKTPVLPAETSKGNTLFFDTGPEISGFELTLETNGEKISMDNVAFSTYPSSSNPANRFSTSWTQLHFRPQTETVVSEARSTSTAIERFEYSSRWESNITSRLILSQAGTTTFFKHPRIMPVMPEGSRRYKNRANGENRKFNSRLERMNTEKHPLSAGWTQCTHPDGAIYFCNRDKRIFTDANIYDTVLYQQMLEDISTIEEFISTHGITLPSNCDLALDVTYNNACQEIQTFYYFVHHPSRSIFFLDNYEAPWCELKGINSSSHLREELEAQYWLYLQLCPQALEISSSLIFELRDTVLQFIGASQSSATIYNLDELYKFLTLIENLERNQGRESNGAVGLLSRLMHSFAQSKVYDSQGKLQPRLKNEIQIVTYAAQASRRTWFIRTISPFLFFSPNLYLRTLRRMWVIGATHNSVWDQGVTRLRHEWRERIFWSILMLIANAAFLSIRDIGLRHPELEHRSGAQISSYVSVIFAIGSIFLGMTFHEHIMANSRDLIGDVSAYAKKRAYSLVGLEARAIVYSLPYVFLIWSIISFATAVGFLVFQDTRRVTRVIVGVFAAAVGVLVIIGVICSWERYTERETAQPLNESPSKSPERNVIAEV
ncbi:hypothetical protein JR316_0009010 [Psilocybe cubensis]|uniref:Uncharacterized protein n=2 Tax=Psilocybe cubensis TaxID=181762 RepID=A0ACB8GSK6_PSICU|nr:hypothetical protein JR316_0009010 [Psilocybe cubensis]KAH9478554.1 hypothetical protein JR316_0009010 [Psilocybe cubensis]